jgi:hypothetical protein
MCHLYDLSLLSFIYHDHYFIYIYISSRSSHERAMKKYHQGWHQTPRGGTRQCHIRGFMVATAVLVHHTLYDPNNH